MTALHYREVAPPTDLQWAIECFWFADGPAEGTERIVPDGCPELVIQLCGSMRAGDEGQPLSGQPRAVLVGQRSRALLVSPASAFRTVAVRLRPAAFGRVLHDDAHRLTDGWASLEEPFGQDGRTLVARIEDGRTDPERCAALVTFLRRRLARARPDRPVDGAVEAIRRARGRITVRALRETTGASERALERAFLREVGLPPRNLAAVLRVQAALLLRDAEPSWASLAAELAYVDQPHLTREFHRVAGLPPCALLDALGPLARAFVDPGRLRELLGVGSVQDRGAGLRTG
ncbi:MAG TPA: AraC family transcriptional regulator [Myxococcaceae bacterium]|nr:AraC family transcriptional regulator [Myxococcaceae bacterium]